MKRHAESWYPLYDWRVPHTFRILKCMRLEKDTGGTPRAFDLRLLPLGASGRLSCRIHRKRRDVCATRATSQTAQTSRLRQPVLRAAALMGSPRNCRRNQP